MEEGSQGPWPPLDFRHKINPRVMTIKKRIPDPIPTFFALIVAASWLPGSPTARADAWEALKAPAGRDFGENIGLTSLQDKPDISLSSRIRAAAKPAAGLTSAPASREAAAAPPPSPKALGAKPSPDSVRGVFVRFSHWLDKVDDKLGKVGHITGIRYLINHHPLFMGGALTVAAIGLGALVGGPIGVVVGATSMIGYVAGILEGGWSPHTNAAPASNPLSPSQPNQ